MSSMCSCHSVHLTQLLLYIYIFLRRFETKQLQEKCVDISLAVEMLYMATVPGALDLAVLVTGDKDFMPALEKTRLLGKRVAICSMRNSCNSDLSRFDARVRDFDLIWLDDVMEDLYVPKRNGNGKGRVWFNILANVNC